MLPLGAMNPLCRSGWGVLAGKRHIYFVHDIKEMYFQERQFVIIAQINPFSLLSRSPYTVGFEASLDWQNRCNKRKPVIPLPSIRAPQIRRDRTMCVIKKVVCMDPEMAQPRKGARRCFHSDGIRPSRRFDSGDFRDIQCHQCERSRAGTLGYQEAPLSEAARQDHSPGVIFGIPQVHKDSIDPFRFRIPFTKRACELNKRHGTHIRRHHKMSQSFERADIPENVVYEYRFPWQPASLVIRSASPRAADVNVPVSRHRRPSTGPLSRAPRAKEISIQRLPTVRRSTYRRSPDLNRTAPPNGYTIVDRSRDNNRQRRTGSQYGDMRDTRRETVTKMPRREFDSKRHRSYKNNKGKFRSPNSFARNPENGHDIAADEIHHQRRLVARSPGLHPHVPGNKMAREARRNHVPHKPSRHRPQIIQDGCRQISETCARIYKEGRVRQSRETFQRSFESLVYRRPRKRT